MIAYYRVSTQKQGRSGLGLEAQRAAIAQFAESARFTVAGEFIEIETGKGADALAQRPQLAAALAAAEKLKCPLVVAKLDRLTRDVHFGSGLMARKVAFRIADMPNADNFQIHIMLSVAELEREMISRRTKSALAAAKARGTVLGNAKQALANRDNAREYAESLREIVAPVINLSSRKIAAHLNAQGIQSPTGKPWQSMNVLRLVERLRA